MAKINILPAKVYNRIAAGEVVDRPYSVVKELVENAIDAGATEIEVSIEQGGKQLIRVTDNGSGISHDDLHSAFLPHATSKIAQAEDLENIMTLGFRGEAVASISAVSKMTITSKTKEGKCYSLFSNGGELGQITEAAGYDGTDVQVEMLFFNTPVRLKFLKSDKAEETDITNVISRFILSRPDIAFTYYANGKKVLQSFGDGFDAALVCVYGASILDNCYKIDAEKHGIRIRGYIGNQNFSKANKSYQSIFLNGRYIINNTISAAISNAYSSYLMKRQYPFYVLYIDLPSEIVDVNVHPNKADVRFADNQIIYGCIYTVIAAVLDGQAKAMEYIVRDSVPMVEEAPASVEPPKTDKSVEMPSVSLTESILNKKDEISEENTEEKSKYQTVFGFTTLTYEEAQKEIEEGSPAFVLRKRGEVPFEDTQLSKIKGFIPADQIPPYIPEPVPSKKKKPNKKTKPNPEKLHERFPDLFFQKNVLQLGDPAYVQAKKEGRMEDYFEENKRFLEKLETQNKQNKIDIATCVYAGKLFNTYLMYEHGDEVFIIDQHAAHERLIFNRLKEGMKNRNVAIQPMLLPFELSVNVFESAFLKAHLKELREMGFVIEESEMQNTYYISAIPLDLQHIQLKAFFNEVLGDIEGYRAIRLEEIFKDKLATAACKAAVKGGMDLTKEEIEALFKMMDGDMGLKCPHGRPVVVKLTKMELEKMFKRIV